MQERGGLWALQSALLRLVVRVWWWERQLLCECLVVAEMVAVKVVSSVGTCRCIVLRKLQVHCALLLQSSGGQVAVLCG
jgi:hypothetical protein